MREPETKPWIGDQIYGFIRLTQVAYGALSLIGPAIASRNLSTRNWWLGLMAGTLLLVLVPVLGILRSRRWGMWGDLILTLVTLIGGVATQLMVPRVDGQTLLQYALILMGLIYLPLR
ncbi:hypothetical protein EON77_17955, partial [bacterium]